MSGDYYRLASWTDKKPLDCWEIAAKDGSEALLTCVQVLSEVEKHSRRICLKGLLPEARYCLEDTEESYTGEELMYCGFLVEKETGDFAGKMYHFICAG